MHPLCQRILDSRANTKPHHRIFPAPRTGAWKPSSGPVTGHRGSYCRPCPGTIDSVLKALYAPAANLLQWPLGSGLAELGPPQLRPAPTGAGRILEFWECLTPPGTHTAPAASPSPGGSRAAHSPGADLLGPPTPHLSQQNISQGQGFYFCFFAGVENRYWSQAARAD